MLFQMRLSPNRILGAGFGLGLARGVMAKALLANMLTGTPIGVHSATLRKVLAFCIAAMSHFA